MRTAHNYIARRAAIILLLAMGVVGVTSASSFAEAQVATGYSVVEASSGNLHHYACAPARVIKGLATSIVFTKNNCTAQGWLNRPVHSICVGPGATLAGRYTPVNIGITDRSGSCGASGASATSLAKEVGGIQPNDDIFAWNSNGPTGGGWIPCNGDYHNIPRNFEPIQQVLINGCTVRVWLKQGISGGWSYCVMPGIGGQNVPARYQYPSIIQVTHNPEIC